MPRAVLHTVFEPSNDVPAMRRFYTELLGLEETFYDAGRAWLTYQFFVRDPMGRTVEVFAQPDAPSGEQ